MKRSPGPVQSVFGSGLPRTGRYTLVLPGHTGSQRRSPFESSQPALVRASTYRHPKSSPSRTIHDDDTLRGPHISVSPPTSPGSRLRMAGRRDGKTAFQPAATNQLSSIVTGPREPFARDERVTVSGS